MNFVATPIKDLWVVEPRVFSDERGFFLESYSRRVFAERGFPDEFVQDNHSRSLKGVLRGLHFQRSPRAQAKFVKVLSGRVWDVAVDLRPGSPTFRQSYGVELSAENRKSFLIPAGFAHGFCVLEDADFFYKCSDYYSPEHDGGILWNDPELGIAWPVTNPLVSAKDAQLPTFRQFEESRKAC